MYSYKEKYTLDFSNIQDYGEIHKIIKKELDFPDNYGENWDAFWDCLTDMVDDEELLYIELIGLETVQKKNPKSSDMLYEILKRLKHYDNDWYYNSVKIEIVLGNARYEIQ